MENDRWQSALRLYLIGAISLILIMTTVRVWTAWAHDAYLDHTSGVMAALAYDLAHGVFYRPLIGPLGYGGSRYFPLHFVVQAALLKLGAGPIITGHLMALASFIFLLAGVYCLLRRLETARWLAACAALAVMSTASVQYGLFVIRSDLLPAALAVWGLALCATAEPAPRNILAAAVLFTLAFSAKETAVYALAAGFLFLHFTGKQEKARRLALFGAAGIALVIAAMMLASDGRAWQVFSVSASGGAGISSLLHAPLRFGIFTTMIDIGGLALLILAIAALLGWPRLFWKDLPPLYFLFALATTLVIFGSPGTDFNHLVDLQVAAIVLIAAWIERASGHARRFGLAALATAVLMSFFPAWNSFNRGTDHLDRQKDFTVAVGMIQSDPRPVLSENPLIPVLAGRSPLVLDPFMFRVIRQEKAHFADALFEMLSKKELGTVILLANPETAFGKTWYAEEHFGPGFAQSLLENYQMVYSGQGEYIFKPRP